MSATTTTDERSTLLDRQRTAISESGWGASFRFVQPRNFTFWVTLFLFVAGVLVTYEQYRTALDAYSRSLAQGTVIFAIYTLVYVFVITKLDRYSRIPARAAIFAFAFGGAVSTFAMSAQLNDAFRSLLAKTAGTDVMLDWGAGIIAPISEETTKIIPLVLMLALAPRVVRSAFDGFILGAWGGLGFMIFEDIAYVYSATGANFGQESFGIQTAVVRIALGFFGHPGWSAVVGAGVIYLVGRPDEPARRGRGVLLILLPMLLHGSWDAPNALSGGTGFAPLVTLVVAIVTVVLIVRVYRMTVVRERNWARDILAPEVDAGVITADELAAGIGRRKHRKHYVKSKENRRERRTAEGIMEGIRDLADEIAAARGADSPGVLEVRAEIAELRSRV